MNSAVTELNEFRAERLRRCVLPDTAFANSHCTHRPRASVNGATRANYNRLSHHQPEEQLDHVPRPDGRSGIAAQRGIHSALNVLVVITQTLFCMPKDPIADKQIVLLNPYGVVRIVAGAWYSVEARLHVAVA